MSIPVEREILLLADREARDAEDHFLGLDPHDDLEYELPRVEARAAFFHPWNRRPSHAIRRN